jgi:hypothetical protein
MHEIKRESLNKGLSFFATWHSRIGNVQDMRGSDGARTSRVIKSTP